MARSRILWLLVLALAALPPFLAQSALSSASLGRGEGQNLGDFSSLAGNVYVAGILNTSTNLAIGSNVYELGPTNVYVVRSAPASPTRFYTRYSWSELLMPLARPVNGTKWSLGDLICVCVWDEATAVNNLSLGAGYWELSVPDGLNFLTLEGVGFWVIVELHKAIEYVQNVPLPMLLLATAIELVWKRTNEIVLGGVLGVIGGYLIKRRRAKRAGSHL